MTLRSLLPQTKETSPEAVIRDVQTTLAQALPPGSEEAKKYCAELSRLIFASPEARQYPELQALGFWLRPASIDSMTKRFLDPSSRDPAGIVFQLPPSNIATLFGYTSSIALLCGNAVIVRLPSAENRVQSLLAALMSKSLMQASPVLRERLVLLRYGHEDALTSELSRACATRLVWGGDATVTHIANLPLSPDGKHVSFGDRYSGMALDANAYLKLDETGRNELIKRIFNDIYVFDQLACSSPRLLVWIGAAAPVTMAAEDLYPRLANCAVEHGYGVGAGESIAKLNAAFLALHDLEAAAYKSYGPQLSVIALASLEHLSPFKSVTYGYGMLLAIRMGRLADLIPWTEQRDQTLSCWGIDETEMQQFSAAPDRQGFDRIVPTGQALAFDPIWDGHNLFDVMTREKP